MNSVLTVFIIRGVSIQGGFLTSIPEKSVNLVKVTENHREIGKTTNFDYVRLKFWRP